MQFPVQGRRSAGRGGLGERAGDHEGSEVDLGAVASGGQQYRRAHDADEEAGGGVPPQARPAVPAEERADGRGLTFPRPILAKSARRKAAAVTC